jgi:hypothetical protein
MSWRQDEQPWYEHISQIAGPAYATQLPVILYNQHAFKVVRVNRGGPGMAVFPERHTCCSTHHPDFIHFILLCMVKSIGVKSTALTMPVKIKAGLSVFSRRMIEPTNPISVLNTEADDKSKY